MKTKKQDLALKRAFDTLIMTTRSNVEFDPIEREEAISNTKWFLLEENHNYDVTDSLAEGEIGLFVDPSQSPSKGRFQMSPQVWLFPNLVTLIFTSERTNSL